MNRSDGRSGTALHPELDLVEFVLGGGPPAAREELRAGIARDLALALEAAETQHLFETMRQLEGAPSGTLLPRLEREFVWRSRLLGRGAERPRFPLSAWLKVAVVAAIWLFVSDLLFVRAPDAATDLAAQADLFAAIPTEFPDGWPRDRQASATTDEDADRFVLPVSAPGFQAAWIRLASRPLAANFADWLSAERVLAKARSVAALRASPSLRASWRNRTGAADVGPRIATLAAEVAARARAGLREVDRDPEALAFALRGLLAAGASTPADPCYGVVVDLCDDLLARLGNLGDGPRATVLAALAEVAVEGNDALRVRIAHAADDLIASICRPRSDHLRPELLQWTQPAYRLADAGRLLLLAPAFGADAAGAFRARLLLAAHLEERSAQRSHDETPELAAAMLYGFADLVDRDDADRRLALWPARLMLPDYLAVSHLTWSSYPIRHGWASLQDQIRGLCGERTPTGIRDSAALLLALCCDVAGAEGPAPLPIRFTG